MTDTNERPLAPVVVAFLRDRIDDLTELKIILLLRRSEGRLLPASAIARDLWLAPELVAPQLERLAVKNLVDVKISEDMLYRLASLAPEQAAAIDILVRIYPEDHLAIAKVVGEGIGSAALDFSDAFRIRRSSKRNKKSKGK